MRCSSPFTHPPGILLTLAPPGHRYHIPDQVVLLCIISFYGGKAIRNFLPAVVCIPLHSLLQCRTRQSTDVPLPLLSPPSLFTSSPSSSAQTFCDASPTTCLSSPRSFPLNPSLFSPQSLPLFPSIPPSYPSRILVSPPWRVVLIPYHVDPSLYLPYLMVLIPYLTAGYEVMDVGVASCPTSTLHIVAQFNELLGLTGTTSSTRWAKISFFMCSSTEMS